MKQPAHAAEGASVEQLSLLLQFLAYTLYSRTGLFSSPVDQAPLPRCAAAARCPSILQGQGNKGCETTLVEWLRSTCQGLVLQQNQQHASPRSC